MMPSNTPRQMRDKAIFALLCLTGIRVEALTSLKIKHVDLDESLVVPARGLLLIDVEPRAEKQREIHEHDADF